jgi:hypothetical protein
MCEDKKIYKGDISIELKSEDFMHNMRAIINHHVPVKYPGLKNCFFPEYTKSEAL